MLFVALENGGGGESLENITISLKGIVHQNMHIIKLSAIIQNICYHVLNHIHVLNHVLLCGSVVEHCVSSAKGCGFDSQGTHILMKMYNLNAIVSRFG